MIRLALLIVLCLVSSCGRISRTSQCRDLAAHVNEALEGIETEIDASTGNPTILRDISQRYERLSKEVDAFVKRDDNHGRALREYATLFRDTSRQLGDLANAVERHDAIAAAKSRRELAVLTRREKPLVTRIEAACLE